MSEIAARETQRPAPGFNPMRWLCHLSGCYNLKLRPKIEIFAEALPGRMACSDIDTFVEINGRFLFLEFKSGSPQSLPIGQRIAFERLSRIEGCSVIAVCGDMETMEIRAIQRIEKGSVGSWEKSSQSDLKERIRQWALRAKAARPLRQERQLA